jgi:hypothetical protein
VCSFIYAYLKESPGRLRPPFGIGRLDTGDGAHEPADPRQVLRLERHLEPQAGAPGGPHGLLDGVRTHAELWCARTRVVHHLEWLPGGGQPRRPTTSSAGILPSDGPATAAPELPALPSPSQNTRLARRRPMWTLPSSSRTKTTESPGRSFLLWTKLL